ncbi:MAG TPA: AI-2E family transporter [Rikenellaceae bacterium]|nr:MAG: AI-2E family transporter [Bacteroidetes bacterium GWE2_40_15]HBZ25668.1 AI-2E family transporter [Rikenellaceae bacterium]
MHLSFQKVFYIIATVLGLFTILILAKGVLIPIAFAFLIAFILFPVARKFEIWGANEIVSAFLSILGLFLIVGATIFLFSNQIIQLSENLTDFKVKILNVFADATLFINKNIGFLPQLDKGELLDKIKNWLNESAVSLLSQTFSSTANIIFDLLTSIIYTFLILIYRKGLVRALISFYSKEHREKAFKMFKSVQLVGQQYLFGMMVIVLILGFVNSIGLWIIGIDYPFLFGFLAAVLALIPYAGTFLGSAIPVLYALISYDSIWMPITIAIFFWLVQLIESNYLTPKIVGGNLKINAFTSIISIIIGASIWGIAGMILFLPFAAMLKTVCEQYIELKPFALLIGDNNYNTKDLNDKFTGEWFKKIKTLFSKFLPSFKK